MNKISIFKHIKSKFIFAGFIICVFSLMSISIISYWTSYKIIEKEINEKISEATLKSANELNMFFIENGAILHSIVMNKEIYDSDDMSLKKYLNGIYKREIGRKSPIIDVYVGFADGKMITGSGWVPPHDYNCLTRPWYQLAIEGGSIVYTVPYLDARTKKMIITVAEPIRKDGSVIAVASADIFVTELIDIVKRVKIGDKSYTFLLDNKQNMLVHPGEEFQPTEKGLKHITEEMNGIYSPLLQKIEKGDDNKIEIIDYDGIKKIVIFSKIKLPGWTFGIVIEKSEYKKPLERLLVWFLFAFALSLAAGTVVMIYLINDLVKPIKHLRNAMKRFSERDFMARSKIYSNDEMGELSSSFNQLADTIQGYNENLEKKIEDRTKELSHSLAKLEESREILKESKETLQAFFDAVYETMLLVDTEGKVLLANAVVAKRLGKDLTEILGTSIYDHLSDDVAAYRKEQYKNVVVTGIPVHFQDERAGMVFEQYCFPVFGVGGKVTGIAIFAREITEHIKAEMLLKESEERYRVLIEHSNDAVALVVGDYHVYVNQKFLDMFGYENNDEVVGKSPFMIVHPDDQEMVTEYNKKRQAGEPVPAKYEFRGIKKDGTALYIEVSAAKTIYNGKPASLAYLRDVSERKRLEQQLQTMSLTDELTGLYNRRGFITLAEQQLKIAERAKKDMLLYFIDLDKMKQINDVFGHQEGDKALVEVTKILKEVFRESDIIGRMGGDEFAVLVIDAPDEARNILTNRFHNILERHNSLETRNYKLLLSIGVARYNHEAHCSLDELIKEADTHMYEEKRNKKY